MERKNVSNGTNSGDILGGENGRALDDITFDDGPSDYGDPPDGSEPPNDGGPPNGDGNSNGDNSGNENNPSRNPFEESVNQAIASVRGEPNRVHHIFGNPTHNHYWYVTGLDNEGNWDLIRQTMCDNQGDIESIPDRIPSRVQTDFDTYTVEVQCIIIDGILRITDAWVIP